MTTKELSAYPTKVQLWFCAVRSGVKTFSQVPKKYKKQVRALCIERGIEIED